MIIYYNKQLGGLERVHSALWNRNGHDSYEIGPLSPCYKYCSTGAGFTLRHKECAHVNIIYLLVLIIISLHQVLNRVKKHSV
jgi:hypothetical protein